MRRGVMQVYDDGGVTHFDVYSPPGDKTVLRLFSPGLQRFEIRVLEKGRVDFIYVDDAEKIHKLVDFFVVNNKVSMNLLGDVRIDKLQVTDLAVNGKLDYPGGVKRAAGEPDRSVVINTESGVVGIEK